MTRTPHHETGDPKGRGSPLEPANRFLAVRAEADYEHFENDEEFFDELRTVPTEFLPDTSRSVVSQNNSPDLPFRYSLNPYRGCEHGCAYCYARPTHEYLGLNAGIDFESKIFVKERAPELFREFLARDGWRGEFVMLSGVTDCYQPAERKFRLTRGCLEVALEARQPLAMITKNARIVRDLDLLRELAARRLAQVAISITTLDESLARTMEPRTSRPAARLRAIRELSAAGVPVRAMLAPLIPGLNDHEVPALMQAVREAGARAAEYTMLRLPLAVAPVFRDWLTRTHPTHAARIEGLIRGTRSGKLYSAKFGERMRGTGLIAEQIERTFRVFARKHGLDQPLPELDSSQFVPPADRAGQRRLF
jgi:DNA repair photolyase